MDAFQDHYPDNVAHCYGCGSRNTHGHQIKTVWEGDESVTRFTPEPYHTSVPGYAYGGLVASLIDCHSTGTAAAAMYRQEGRSMDSLPAFRFVTGPARQNSCRLNRTKTLGAAMKDEDGSTQTSIQRQSGGEVATARERCAGHGLTRDGCKR